MGKAKSAKAKGNVTRATNTSSGKGEQPHDRPVKEVAKTPAARKTKKQTDGEMS